MPIEPLGEAAFSVEGVAMCPGRVAASSAKSPQVGEAISFSPYRPEGLTVGVEAMSTKTPDGEVDGGVANTPDGEAIGDDFTGLCV